MRFTASKEAGDPHTHLVRISGYAVLIAFEKASEMLLELSCDNVLFKFLPDVGVIALSNLDNSLDVTVNGLCEHIPDDH